MLTLLFTMFLACGDKEEEQADTSSTAEPAEEQVEDTSTEDTSVEEPADSGTEETTDATFLTNEQLGVCYLEGEVA